jgi:HSP20 family protein
MASIMRYDPFSEMMTLRRAMDELFSQSFVNPQWRGGPQGASTPMDVCETDHGYEVNVGLPGVKPEDIDITVTQNTLSVRGQYSYQNDHQDQHQNQQGQQNQQVQQGQNAQHQNWLMREMETGSFERTITFPKPIDADKIQTKYENGILTLTVPISEASRPKRITVNASQSQPRTIEANTR